MKSVLAHCFGILIGVLLWLAPSWLTDEPVSLILTAGDNIASFEAFDTVSLPVADVQLFSTSPFTVTLSNGRVSETVEAELDGGQYRLNRNFVEPTEMSFVSSAASAVIVTTQPAVMDIIHHHPYLLYCVEGLAATLTAFLAIRLLLKANSLFRTVEKAKRH